MFGSQETHAQTTKKALAKIFPTLATSITDEETLEAITMADVRGAAPTRFPKDMNELQKLGDAALDYHMLRILRKKGFNGSFEAEKARLLGNEATQPLNQLFDRFGLKDLILSLSPTDSLSPHQKADAVEAIFGLLEIHNLLSDAIIEGVFKDFLPTVEKLAAPAPRRDLTTAEVCSLPSSVLPVLIKTEPQRVERLADEVLAAIVKDFASKPSIEKEMLARANIIVKEYKKHQRFFELCLNDDTLSPEKFKQLYPKQAASYVYPDPRRPIHARKVAPFLDVLAKQRLAGELIRELATQPPANAPQFATALLEVTNQLRPCEFLIEDFNNLPEGKQALLPGLHPLKHFKRPERSSMMVDVKILSLELTEFKACVAMLDPSGIRAQQIKTEIEHRMKGTDIKAKTLAHYQEYLDCLRPPAPAAASTTPMEAHHRATGAASSTSTMTLR
jgi:hypothetical protein